MRNELQEGYQLVLSKRDIFTIKSIIGRGASCLVYLAERTVKNSICHSIIKEFNPIHLDLERDKKGCLNVTPDKKEKFINLLNRFREGYEKQQKIRIINDLTNTTSNIQGIYQANNTEYIEMTYFSGKTYSFDCETSLYDFLRRMKALTQVIGNYHKAGFLHLDIKPENFFIMPETPEMVMLFDFDSVKEKNEVLGDAPLSYTKNWSAIEQIDARRRKEICEATDLFAVGEMIFYYIFGRHSEIGERRSFSNYSFDYNNKIFEGVNPLIFDRLSELLKKTLSNVVSNRYQTAQKLVEKLDEIILLSNPDTPFLKTNIPHAADFFVGRDDEIEDIHTSLCQTDTVFISGIGGIGKSELVKHYAKKYVDSYDAIIFAPFIRDVFTLITDDTALPICNFRKFPEEKREDYYYRKIRKLKELCNNNILIIIDNFNSEDELDKITELNCKLLFTTRHDFSDLYRQIDLTAIKDRKFVNAIFRNFYVKTLSNAERSIVREIIDIVDGHTMTIELLAKQMMAGRVTPQNMLERLKNKGISDIGEESVRIQKDEKLKTGNAYAHIKALFDLSELGEEEKSVLAALSLIPYTGMPTELFCKWCKIDNFDIINNLIEEGWIRHREKVDYISLHPLIAQVSHNMDDFQTLILSFLENSKKYVKNDEFEKMSPSQKYKTVKIFSYICNQLYTLDFNSLSEAVFLENVSNSLWEYGNLQNAIVYCKKALEIKSAISDISNIETATTQMILSKMYRRLGDFEIAEEYVTNALQSFINEYGESHEKVAECYDVIGDICNIQCKYSESKESYNKALNIYRSLYNEDECSQIADIYKHIGILCYGICEYDKSKDYLNNALRINLRVFGERHPQVAMTNKAIGRLYYKQGQFENAKKYSSESLKVLLQFYGEYYRNTLLLYNDLALLYECNNDFDEAEICFLKIIKIAETLFGKESMDLASYYYNIASFYRKTEKYELSEEYCVKAISIMELIDKTNSFLMGYLYNNLGLLYLQKKDYSMSEDCFLKSLNIKKQFEEFCNGIAVVYSNLARSYDLQDKFQLAEETYLLAIDIFNKAYDKDDKLLSNTYKKLGDLYKKNADTKKARDAYENAGALRKKCFGENAEELQEIKELLNELTADA